MDIDLIEASIKYHGKGLYDELARENDLESSKESIRYKSEEHEAASEFSYQTDSDLGRYV